jgi:hypothetical protein
MSDAVSEKRFRAKRSRLVHNPVPEAAHLAAPSETRALVIVAR